MAATRRRRRNPQRKEIKITDVVYVSLRESSSQNAASQKNERKTGIYRRLAVLVRAVPRRKGLAGPSLHINSGGMMGCCCAHRRPFPFQKSLPFIRWLSSRDLSTETASSAAANHQRRQFGETQGKKKRISKSKKKWYRKEGAGLTFPTQGRKGTIFTKSDKIRQFRSKAIGLDPSQSQSLTNFWRWTAKKFKSASFAPSFDGMNSFQTSKRRRTR